MGTAAEARPVRRRPSAAPLIGAMASLALLAPTAGTVRATSHSPTVPDGSAATSLLIEGAGEGHGVGMSQLGAEGLAAHGYTYRQILGHYYAGTSLGSVPRSHLVRVLIGTRVRRIPIERYVRGVLTSEMPAESPLAALQAQAVAIRTYAITDDAGGRRFDVYADTRSQVYSAHAATTPASRQAIALTAGQIVTYGGRPAITYYFASSGGMTEAVQNAFPGAAAEPWLHGVQDPFEGGAQSHWRVVMSLAHAQAQLAGQLHGRLLAIEVAKRGYSPRILQAVLLGSGGRSRISGDELAALLGLNSTWAHFFLLKGSLRKAEPDSSAYTSPPAEALPPAGEAPAANAAGRSPGARPRSAPGADGGTRAGGESGAAARRTRRAPATGGTSAP